MKRFYQTKFFSAADMEEKGYWWRMYCTAAVQSIIGQIQTERKVEKTGPAPGLIIPGR